MATRIRLLVACLVTLGAMLVASTALAAGPQLHWVYGGNNGGTIVFIHGKSDCSPSMGDCNSGMFGYELGYWTNHGNTGENMLQSMRMKGSTTYDVFTVGYDLVNQGFWSSANDVGSCLSDLANGSNNSGCNPSRYQRSSFHVVTHSAGATVIDRLLSTGWWGINSHVSGWVVALAPALTGSYAASVLYNQMNANGAWYCNNPKIGRAHV